MSVIAYYEPRRLKEPDFLASFVAREDLVEFLLHQLRMFADGDARHRLILGQRGMGKTSLLRRLQIGIRDDPELTTKLLPLTFREEQYNVRSLDRFWHNCGEALAEWLEVSGDQAGANELDRYLQDPVWKKPDTAAEAFAERVLATGRRTVLLVDNLDLILDALPDQQRWQLRRILQSPRGPILFGAATQPPGQLGDPSEAFYEFFRWDLLEPLTEPEMMTCIRRLAAANPGTSAPVVAVLERAPERLRVLHTLTGGNPRILALLYGMLERADSDSVHSNLEGLLDQVTPLYKARVEELRSDLQRAVFDAIALHWDPITTHDLSMATGIGVTGLSPQIARLKDWGLIEEVPTSGARAGYQLGERFFNVWYLMRHGTRHTKQRMRWLTGFLETFYSPGELMRLRDPYSSRPGGGAWATLYVAALDEAIVRNSSGFRAPPTPNPTDLVTRPRHLGGGQLHSSVEAAFQTALDAMTAGHDEKAEATLRAVIKSDPAFAPAWEGLGILLADQPDRIAETEEAFRTAIQIAPKKAWPWIGLGRILTNDMNKHIEAEEAFRTATRLNPNVVWSWLFLGDLLADSLHRHSEAEEAYGIALRMGPDDGAWAKFGLISLYASTLQFDKTLHLRESISVSDTVGQTLLDATIEVARENFGRATAMLGAALGADLGSPNGLAFKTLHRLLRLFKRQGYGERLIQWFIESGHADSHSPIHAAFVALVRGANALLDVNPEVRAPAERIFARLAGPQPITDPSPPTRSRRGRPRRHPRA